MTASTGSPDLAIETRGLRKEYRGRRGRSSVAVQDLELRVPFGGVHGFLGPNGSGKTTTIRMLLGLARPSAGEVRSDLAQDFRRLHPEFTGTIALPEQRVAQPLRLGPEPIPRLARHRVTMRDATRIV